MKKLLQLLEMLVLYWGRRARGRLARTVVGLRLQPSHPKGTYLFHANLGVVSHVPATNTNIINETSMMGGIGVLGKLVNNPTGVIDTVIAAGEVINHGQIGSIELADQVVDVHVTGKVAEIRTLGNVYLYGGGVITDEVTCAQFFVWGQHVKPFKIEVTDLYVIDGQIAVEGSFSGTLMRFAGGDITGDLSWKHTARAPVAAQAQQAAEKGPGLLSTIAGKLNPAVRRLQVESSDNSQEFPVASPDDGAAEFAKSVLGGGKEV